MSEQNIGKEYLAWMGSSTEECVGASLADLSGDLMVAFRVLQGGAGVSSSKPGTAGIGITYSNFHCGGGYFLKGEGDSTYTVGSMVATSLDVDAGKIALAFPETVVFSDGIVEGINGLYKMTTTFSENKPTYYNGTYWLWFDGTGWVLSTPNRDKSGVHYMNNSLNITDRPYNDSEGNPGAGSAIPGGALYTEDAASVLAVEDLAAVITTEG